MIDPDAISCGIRERTANVEGEADAEPPTVYVVIDNGDVSQGGCGWGHARGVYHTREAAETRKEEVNGPFKSVSISQTSLYGGDV